MMDFSGIKELSIGGVSLRELSVDGIKIWQAGRLPSGYTEVEYIESTGTQYINTGITGHSDVSVEIDVVLLEPIPSTEAGVIGSTNSSSQRCYLNANPSVPPFRWNFAAGSSYNMEPTTWQLDTKYKININWGSSSSTMRVDGSLHMTMPKIDFDNGMNLYLFARNNNGSAEKLGSVRMYYVKMWDGISIARDFVPAKRKSDSAVGMFDLATGSFFSNSGTGSFVAGPAVV